MMQKAWGFLFSCALIGSVVGVAEVHAVAVDGDCLVGKDTSSSTCHLELLQKKAQALSTPKGGSAESGNETATCMVWGPSHVHVFDEKEVTWMAYLMSFFRTPSIESDLDVTEVGDFWLVNSPYVKIQGRYNLAMDNNEPKPFLRAVTVGGKFLEDNTITIGTADRKAQWNDEEILVGAPSSFSVDRLVNAKYSLKVPHAHDPSKSGPGIRLELPLGINMIVNRGNKSLELAITMPKIPDTLGGQDGQCGNFNGDNEDDTAELIDGRMTLKVMEEELLLKYPFKGMKDSLKKIHQHTEPVNSSGEKVPKFTAIHGSASNEATCTVWGDPHITVFDNRFNALEPQHLSLSQNDVISEALSAEPAQDGALTADLNAFELGDCWLVKSSQVSIQGRYNVVASSNYKKPFLRAVAIGGTFIQGNKIVIGMNSTFWNDQEILTEPNSAFSFNFTKFSVKNAISARNDARTPLVQDKRRSSPGIDLKLPLGVKLLVNRHKNGLGLAITMPKVEGGQEGQCGNYNGQKGDDTAELISGRLGSPEIAYQDVLFRNVFHLAQAKKAMEQAPNPSAELTSA